MNFLGKENELYVIKKLKKKYKNSMYVGIDYSICNLCLIFLFVVEIIYLVLCLGGLIYFLIFIK